MSTTTTPRSAVSHPSPDSAALSTLDTIKLAAKGPGVPAWCAKIGLPFPAKLYDTLTVEGALIARVGNDEFVLEADPANPLLQKISAALDRPDPSVYRIEQQSATFVLRGEKAEKILLQTCGVEMPNEPLNRIVFTRVAAVSCGMIPQEINGERAYRLWCDYTLAPYLWENLSTILAELSH